MDIHRLLHSSCCSLNTNTVTTPQLIGIARTLEAEWWQVCGEAWVRGQRKMSQVLGAFGLLHFTMLRPVLPRRAFLNLWTVYFFNFPIFFRATANRGYGGPPVYTTAVFNPTAGLTITNNPSVLINVQIWKYFTFAKQISRGGKVHASTYQQYLHVNSSSSYSTTALLVWPWLPLHVNYPSEFSVWKCLLSPL
jgi:hypothetical protein